MINLMPDMWFAEMQPDLDEDDIEEYGRLVIDLPDPPVDTDCSAMDKDISNENEYSHQELRGYSPSPIPESISPTQSFTKATHTKPQKVLPIRNNRDVPIKLLLKRSFQNNKKANEKRPKLDTEEKQQVNESIESNANTLPAFVGSQKRANDSVQRVYPHNYMKNTTYASPKDFSNQVKIQERSIRTNYVRNGRERSYPMNLIQITTPTVYSKKQNTINEYMSHNEECLECKLNQMADVNRRASFQNYMQNETTLSYDKPNALNCYIRSYKDKLLSAQNHYSNQVETGGIFYEKASQNNTNNNEKNPLAVLNHSSTSNQLNPILQQEQKQRISVVSNDFLFQNMNEREIHENRRNSRYLIDSELRSPQLYHEALFNLMKHQYRLPVRENNTLTVNRQILHQESLKKIADARFTQMIHTDRITKPQKKPVKKNIAPTQKPRNIAKQTTKMNKPIPAESSPKPENEASYNILIHRGPDVNRIVITIANENELYDTTDQSISGDQRVPESMNNSLNSEVSQVNRKKRSYHYKEPSLRYFRRQSLNQPTQKQIGTESNRFESPDYFDASYQNVPMPEPYSYLGNRYESPVAVTENHIRAQNYISPVTQALPHELYDRRLIESDRISRRLSDTEKQTASQNQISHLDPHEEEILNRPLNLSLKPISPDERLYPASRYPVCTRLLLSQP